MVINNPRQYAAIQNSVMKDRELGIGLVQKIIEKRLLIIFFRENFHQIY